MRNVEELEAARRRLAEIFHLMTKKGPDGLQLVCLWGMMSALLWVAGKEGDNALHRIMSGEDVWTPDLEGE